MNAIATSLGVDNRRAVIRDIAIQRRRHKVDQLAIM
jgi:hypothetical protein